MGTRYAYEAFCGMKARSKKMGFKIPDITAREFMGWWMKELETFNGKIPTCGRIDHSKAYSWDNFVMQDMADNSREAALRNQLSGHGRKASKKILVIRKDDNQIVGSIGSIRMTARFFKVSQRLIQFIVRGKNPGSKHIKYDLKVAA